MASTLARRTRVTRCAPSRTRLFALTESLESRVLMSADSHSPVDSAVSAGTAAPALRSLSSEATQARTLLSGGTNAGLVLAPLLMTSPYAGQFLQHFAGTGNRNTPHSPKLPLKQWADLLPTSAPYSGPSVGAGAVDAASATDPASLGLTIPAGHARLWFTAGRLDRARAWFAAHPVTPDAGDEM